MRGHLISELTINQPPETETGPPVETAAPHRPGHARPLANPRRLRLNVRPELHDPQLT